MCSKQVRSLYLLLLSFFIGFCFTSSLTANEPQIIEDIAAASVRVFARDGSLGSGSVFYKNENEILILTNAHVAGSTRSNVKVEFWYQGRLSKKVPGVVVRSHLSNQTDHDYALINIQREDLGSYFDLIQPIPLAEINFVPDFSKIFSAGCPQGTWQTHWIGHGTENIGDQAVKFVPMPANGRSGSGIYQVLEDGKIVQVGLITYRTRAPGKDGASETDGEGIAQTISHVRKHMESPQVNAGGFIDHIDDWKYELVPVQDCPGGVCPPAEQSILIIGEPEKYSLRYVDPGAEGRSRPADNPLLLRGLNGKLTTQPTQQSELNIFPSLPKKLDNCPDGQCPPERPKIEPQPQELPPRREIFPNLPLPRREQPESPSPAPAQPKLIDRLDSVPEYLQQLRRGQEETTGLIANVRERFDRRMDLMEQHVETQRQQIEQSLKESADGIERGIIGRLLNLPLIRQVRWVVQVLFWPLVLFAIWWVPAFLLNLGPLWFLPVIRAVKGFVSAAWAGLKEVFTKKQAAPPSEQELSEMIAEILKKRDQV